MEQASASSEPMQVTEVMAEAVVEPATAEIPAETVVEPARAEVPTEAVVSKH